MTSSLVAIKGRKEGRKEGRKTWVAQGVVKAVENASMSKREGMNTEATRPDYS